MSPAMEGALETSLFLGSIGLVTVIGQFLVQRKFYKPVVDPERSFPIILRPYRWMIILSYAICSIFVVLGIFLLFGPTWPTRFIGVIVMVVVCLLVTGTFQSFRQYIRISSDGFEYVKSSSKIIEIKGSKITTFYATPGGGNLVIGIYGMDRKVAIPLMFQNINLLNLHMTRWQNEERTRSFKNWRPKEVN